METVIASLIAGGFALIGTIITVKHNNQKMLAEMKAEYAKEMQEMKAEFAKAQAVMDCRVDELTREVREHNNFARRLPVVEQQVTSINEKIKILHSGA